MDVCIDIKIGKLGITKYGELYEDFTLHKQAILSPFDPENSKRIMNDLVDRIIKDLSEIEKSRELEAALKNLH